MPLLPDLAAYMATLSLGTVKTSSAQTAVPWLIYMGVQPPGDRSDAISLTVYGGDRPLETMGTGISGVVAEQPRVQILARHISYETAMTKAQAIWNALHGKGNMTLGTTRYLRLEALQSPFPIGRDDATRFLIGFNMTVWKELG